ncbi:MAG: hypothetical protein HKO03_09055, partial [Acidimicrobiia bacterium]|nr:hypothetical protein [Acidimicrobiia bacterium]
MKSVTLFALVALLSAGCSGGDATAPTSSPATPTTATTTSTVASTTVTTAPLAAATTSSTTTIRLEPVRGEPELLVAQDNSIYRYSSFESAPELELEFDCEIVSVVGDHAGNLFFEACHPDHDGIYFLAAGSDSPLPVVVGSHLDPISLEDLVQLESAPTLLYARLVDFEVLRLFALDLLTGEETDLGVIGGLEELAINLSASAEAVSHFGWLSCTRARGLPEGQWTVLTLPDSDESSFCHPDGAAFVEQLGNGLITYVEAEGEVVPYESELGYPDEILIAASGRLIVGVPIMGGTPSTTIPFPEPWRIDRIDQEQNLLIIMASDGGETHSFPSPAKKSTEIVVLELDTNETTTVPGNYGTLTVPLSPYTDELITR